MNKEGIFQSFIIQKYIAHRGLHDSTYPENSLGAFQNAIDNGYGIELDVQMLADGTVVVFHDNKLSRLTGKDGYLNKLTKDNLKDYKLLGTEYCIPTLQEVLDLVNGQTGILVEIKNDTTHIGQLEKAVCKILKDYKGDYAIMSMNPLTLEWFAKYRPSVVRGQLASYYKLKDVKGVCLLTRMVLKRMKLNHRSQPDFIAYKIEDLPNRYVKRYKDLPLLGWTVRSQEQYMKKASTVDNIIFEGFTPKI